MLKPIIKGAEIFHQILSPTIDEFKAIFQSRKDTGFELDKDVKDTVNESFNLKERWKKLAGII